MEDQIKVSIITLAYNHENYIRECLEGIVNQKTNFTFELLIHDDASTDKTAKIIKEYEVKYPNIIKPIYQKVNQYSKGIPVFYKFNSSRAKGKYVAICEGDDYWTDPLKLQKQVDFLEANEDYGLVYTDKIFYYQKENRFVKSKTSQIIEVDELLASNKIPTLTTCFRANLLFDYLEKFYPLLPSFPFGDYSLWLYIISKTKLYHLPEYTSVYRVLSESASHSKNIKKKVFFQEKVYECREFFIKKLFPNKLYLIKPLKHRQASAILNTCIAMNEKESFLNNLNLIQDVDKFWLRRFYMLGKYNFLVVSFLFRITYFIKKWCKSIS